MNSPKHSLRRKVVLISAAAMLAMAAVMMLVFILGFNRIWSNTFHAIGKSHDKLLDMSRESARDYWRDAISQSCMDIVFDIDSVTRGLEINARLLAALERFQVDRALTQKILDEFGDSNPDIPLVVYAWKDGEYAVANQRQLREGFDPLSREWYQKALQAFPNPYWTPLYEGYTAREKILSVSQALAAPDGELTGALCIDIRLSELAKLAAKHTVNGRMPFLLDENLFPVFPERLPGDEPFRDKPFGDIFQADKSLEEALASAKIREKGTWELTTGQRQYLVSLAPCLVSNWTVGTLIPIELVDLSVTQMGRETDSTFQELEYSTTYWGHMLKAGAILAMLVVLPVFLLLLRLSIIKGLHPLDTLTQGVRAIGRGELNVRLPPSNEEEIHTLSIAYNEMTSNLERYISLLQDETARAARIESELQLARSIQMGLLPTKFPDSGGIYDIYAVMQPAQQVGGDLYDFVRQGEKLYFAVADVSDKGVAAGLFMSVVKTLFRGMIREGKNPGEMLRHMNEMLVEQNPQKMFVTMFAGLLDVDGHSLKYASAGHCPPLYAPPGKVFSVLACLRSLPLGIVAAVPYTEIELDFAPGSRLFAYTDGVTEAMSKENELYGVHKLLAALNQTGNKSPRESLDIVLDSIREHVGDATAADDITMLMLQENIGTKTSGINF